MATTNRYVINRMRSVDAGVRSNYEKVLALKKARRLMEQAANLLGNVYDFDEDENARMHADELEEAVSCIDDTTPMDLDTMIVKAAGVMRQERAKCGGDD